MRPAALVDAHLHLWDPARLHYAWLAEVPAIASAHGLAELETAREEIVVEAAVFVQCDCARAENEAEVSWVSALAQADPRLAGIVAGIPLEQGTAVLPLLERYAANPLVKGVRRLIQSESNPRFCLQPGFLTGITALERFGFSFDLCIRHEQLAAVIELVERAPGVTFLLDHLGKPDVRSGRLEPWKRDLTRLARLPNVACKLSGLVTEADHARWTPAQLEPYLEHALACFGSERLLFGSDWPVMRLATTYARWVETLCAFLEPRSNVDERERIWRSNARRLYRLGPSAAAPVGC